VKITPPFKSGIGISEWQKLFFDGLFDKRDASAVDNFRSRLSDYLGVEDIAFVPSARWGLYHILTHLNIPEGSEVVLSAFNYFAVPAAVVRAGMKPVFADISRNSLNLDAARIEESITPQTRAIIATHLCGFSCDLDSLCKIAKKHNLFLIEDCVQAVGAEFDGKKLGSIGDAALFSFGLTKNFNALGGAAITVKNKDVLSRIRSSLSDVRPCSRVSSMARFLKALVISGATQEAFFFFIYWIIRLSDAVNIDIINKLFREDEALMKGVLKTGLLDGLQAKAGIYQLSVLEKQTEMRIARGLKMYSCLSGISDIRVPLLESRARNIFSSCPVFSGHREEVRRFLLKKGIVTTYGFMRNCANFKLFSAYANNVCLNAGRVEKGVIYLPLFPDLKDERIKFIADCLKKFP